MNIEESIAYLNKHYPPLKDEWLVPKDMLEAAGIDRNTDIIAVGRWSNDRWPGYLVTLEVADGIDIGTGYNTHIHDTLFTRHPYVRVAALQALVCPNIWFPVTEEKEDNTT